jgi:hypothetical protein
MNSSEAADVAENIEERGGSRASAGAARGGENLVEYDGPALVELSLGERDYRIDVGKAGTALCISTRASGTWDWVFGGEARWENRRLRARGLDLDRDVLDVLSKALVEVSNGD